MQSIVLVVDDHIDIAEALRLILDGEGFDVLVALDGASALDLICSVRPSIVVSDVPMPGMTGAELCSAIRAHPAYKTLPIVVASALPESVARQQFDCYDAYLRKPVDPAELIELLRRLIEKPLHSERPSLRHSWQRERFGAAARAFLGLDSL